MSAQPSPTGRLIAAAVAAGGTEQPVVITKARPATMLSVSPGTIGQLRDDGEIKVFEVRGVGQGACLLA